jgi:hypothetical protein
MLQIQLELLMMSGILLETYSDFTAAGHHMRMYTRGFKYNVELVMLSGMPLETC